MWGKKVKIDTLAKMGRKKKRPRGRNRIPFTYLTTLSIIKLPFVLKLQSKHGVRIVKWEGTMSPTALHDSANNPLTYSPHNQDEKKAGNNGETMKGGRSHRSKVYNTHARAPTHAHTDGRAHHMPSASASTESRTHAPWANFTWPEEQKWWQLTKRLERRLIA